MRPDSIKIEEYNYNLPQERIAIYPLPERDSSKLLFLNGDSIAEKKFSDLPELLPSGALLVFNKTRVVNARLLFKKATGASIEIFCLEPVLSSNDFQIAFQKSSPVTWKCLVGNSKRWKSGKLSMDLSVNDINVVLTAQKKEQMEDGFLIEFTWNREVSFSEIIEASGMIPIPPYLNRKSEESDKNRYQTIYAENEGSVAAPTAGLHFTNNTFEKLKKKNIETDELTLHVGAGTFKPVVAESISEHKMHVEKVVVELSTLVHLLAKIENNHPIIPVGTTSMRTLESLYYFGLKLKNGDESMIVDQWDPYNLIADISAVESINLIIGFLKKNKLNAVKGETRLMIAPGYKFKFATGLITNFHQPKSTLLLLVSALIGQNWKKAYDFALNSDFRFLSYGDSCLFLPQ